MNCEYGLLHSTPSIVILYVIPLMSHKLYAKEFLKYLKMCLNDTNRSYTMK